MPKPKPEKKSLVEKLFPTCPRCGRRLSKCPGHDIPREGMRPATRDTAGRKRQPRVKTMDTGKKFGR
jgi:hypothetical protein